jgi:hypothetical protein
MEPCVHNDINYPYLYYSSVCPQANLNDTKN